MHINNCEDILYSPFQKDSHKNISKHLNGPHALFTRSAAIHTSFDNSLSRLYNKASHMLISCKLGQEVNQKNHTSQEVHFYINFHT